MREDATALKVAIDLLQVPSRLRPVRAMELPADILTLLEISAGDAQAIEQASRLTSRDPQVVREAAAFYIEQVLLAPDSDSYRVLGAKPQASSGDLRRNMALLLRWLHPDMEHDGAYQGQRDGHERRDRSVFAARVTLAWDDLKTPERRAAYDSTRPSHKVGTVRHSGKSIRGRSGARGASVPPRVYTRVATVNGGSGPPPGRLWRALLTLFGAIRH